MKKGFTLIELLAVIIILAVIALIATPLVLDVVSDAEEESRLQTVNGYIEATRMYISEAMIKDLSLEGNLFDTIKGRVKGTKPETGEIYVGVWNKIAVALQIDGYCYIKQFDDAQAKRSDGGECSLSSSNDVTYEVTAPTYEIDMTECVKYYKTNFGMTEEMATGFCDGTVPVEGISVPYALKNGFEYPPTISVADLRTNHIIKDTTSTQRLTCIVKEKLVESYEVDETKCKEWVGKMIGSFAENSEAYCAPNQDNELGNMRTLFDISYAYVDSAIEIGAIKNVVYSDDYIITGYRCYEGNDFGLPIEDVVIPNDVTQIGFFSFFNRKINNVDFSNATKLENINSAAFATNNIQTLDLSGATSLKTIGMNAFTLNKLTTIKVPMSVKTIDTTAFTSSEENIVITIDQYEDAITGKPWGAANATINWLPCDGTVQDNLVSYKIDDAKCSKYFISQGLTEAEANAFCAGTGTVNGANLEFYLSIPELKQMLIDEEIFYDLAYEKICQSCFQTVDEIVSYEIDTNICPNVIALNNSELTQAEITTVCAGGTLDSGYSVAKLVRENPYGVVSLNLIKNVEYDHTKTEIAKYLCGGNNQNSMPENRDLVIPNTIDGKAVVRLSQLFIYPAVIDSVDFSQAKNLKEIMPFAFQASLTSSIESIDLSGATSLTYIGSKAFESNYLKSITLPNSVTTIDTDAFSANSALTNITIDKISGSINGAPWGASSATVNWLRTQ